MCLYVSIILSSRGGKGNERRRKQFVFKLFFFKRSIVLT